MFWKKKAPRITTLKCPAAGCPFTCDAPVLIKRHTDWKHPELTKAAVEQMPVTLFGDDKAGPIFITRIGG